MKILYRYAKTKEASPLTALGVTHAFVKRIRFSHEKSSFTKKRHYHADVEVHFILSGKQIYAVGDTRIPLSAGTFLLIVPQTEHRVVSVSEGTEKLALCFRTREAIAKDAFLSGETPLEMQDALTAMIRESDNALPFSSFVIEARTEELIALCLRIASGSVPQPQAETGEEDSRFLVAKEFIEDNITQSPTVAEVAAITHLSEKQLSRIFKDITGKTVADHIRQRRVAHIELLLLETNLSLSEISERMHFSSEYYFNRFFKTHAGMTPGAYRRSVSKQERKATHVGCLFVY